MRPIYYHCHLSFRGKRWIHNQRNKVICIFCLTRENKKLPVCKLNMHKHGLYFLKKKNNNNNNQKIPTLLHQKSKNENHLWLTYNTMNSINFSFFFKLLNLFISTFYQISFPFWCYFLFYLMFFINRKSPRNSTNFWSKEREREREIWNLQQ